MNSVEVIADNSRWQGGYFYDSPLTQNIALKEICTSPANIYSTVECRPVEADSFYLATTERTSTFNRLSKDLYSRTLQSLLAYEGSGVEIQFVLNPLSLNTPYLLDPTNTLVGSSTPLSVPDALALIEYNISLWGLYAMRPMVFVTHRMMIHMTRHQMIRREGNIWLTPMDTIVVPLNSNWFTGQGTGDLPPLGADEEYMYATTGVQVRRSEIITLPEQGEATSQNPFGYPPSAVNREINDLIVSTQRIYGVTFTTNEYLPVCYAAIDFSLPF